MSAGWSGGVAQLGERLLCKQEVIGSIPFTSTILADAILVAKGGESGRLPMSLGMKFPFRSVSVMTLPPRVVD